MRTAFRSLLIALSFLAMASAVSAETWEPYTGADNLRRLLSDVVMEGTLREGVKATARYNGDGTGELTAWGDAFPRIWRVEGEDRVCIQVGREENCVSLEKSVDQENTYRATVDRTGESVVFTVQPAGQPIVVAADTKGAGGATEPSADEIAQSLANPNTPLASQTFKIQYRLFEGDLPDADDQDDQDQHQTQIGFNFVVCSLRHNIDSSVRRCRDRGDHRFGPGNGAPQVIGHYHHTGQEQRTSQETDDVIRVHGLDLSLIHIGRCRR